MRKSPFLKRARRTLRELRERSVYQVSVAYLAATFVGVQLADLAAGAFDLPTWFEPLTWSVFGLGFPLALIMTWAFELTPEGVRRAPRSGPYGEKFLIDEEVCANLDRDRLDPRMIGDRLTYLDNHARSDVLVCYLHGFGMDAGQYRAILKDHPFRAIAPTFYGFEPDRSERVALEYDDHVTLLRQFLQHCVSTVEPRTTVIVGMSSGADVALKIGATCDSSTLLIDGILALGPNLGTETLFATRVFGHLSRAESEQLPGDLARLGANVASLEEWILAHKYLVETLQKFGDDLEPLRRFAAGLILPFEQLGSDAFIQCYRDAYENVRAIICVIADSKAERAPLERIKAKNLDEGTLGPHFRPGTLRVAHGANHFDLDSPESHAEHLRDLLEMLGVQTQEVPERAEGFA